MYFSRGGGITPLTATSLTSPDGLVWTLKLRPNIKFSDGTAYDASAVKFNWARVQDPATGSPGASIAKAMKTIDVVDPLTVRVTLTDVQGQFPRAVARALPAV